MCLGLWCGVVQRRLRLQCTWVLIGVVQGRAVPAMHLGFNREPDMFRRGR